MEVVYRRMARLLEIKSIVTLPGTEVQTRENVTQKHYFWQCFHFSRFKKHRKYGKVSSFEGPIILKKDLQLIEVKYINVHCESVLLALQ